MPRVYSSHDNSQLYREEWLDKYEGWEKNFDCYEVPETITLNWTELMVEDCNLLEALIATGQAKLVTDAHNS